MTRERTMNLPIPGHELIAEGHTRTWVGRDGATRYSGGCRCGEKPEGFPDASIYATKRWHRQHKAELRQDGAA